MAGVKEGSVMEGIFAMYCAAYLIDPQSGRSHSKIESFINDLRVDTSLGDLLTPGKKSVDYNKTFPQHAGPAKKHFGGGNSPISIVTGKAAKVMIKNSPKYETLSKNLPNAETFFESVKVAGYPDFTQVILKVRVKEAETGKYYGANLQKLLDEEAKKGGKGTPDKTYQSIKQRMQFLIKNKETSFFRSLKAAKERYLKNKESDVIHWTVDADGISGETSGGDIKQDVTIKIMADGVKVLEDELNFSLKASSSTIHGGGVYNTMEEVYKMFKGIIPENKRKQGVDFMNDIKNQTTVFARKDAIDSLWRLIGESIPAQPNTTWSDHFWGVLESRLFGSSAEYHGRIQLLEMNQNELREITKDNFLRLKRSGILLFPQYRESGPGAAAPGDIRVMPKYADGTVETSTDNALFKMRPSYLKTGEKDASGKRQGKAYPNKIFIELGGVKSIVHDENYQDFLDKGLV
tara:strand:+ start:530 stop:1915 length:1386 start_codon:yes stop_codon:yes gene_type:complete